MVKLPKVMTAFGKRAMKGKSMNEANEVATVKKRGDFASDKLYGKYVGQNVVKGSVVRLLEDFRGLNIGDLCTVVSQEQYPGQEYVLKVMWSGREVSICSHRVEILTQVPQCNCKASK